MYRTISLIAALLTASASHAQTVGPSIGYVKGSAKGDAIHLVNPDGTGDVRVYQAPRLGRLPGQVDRLSLRPGGGEVAFILNSNQLMIQEYDANGPTGDAFEINLPGTCGLFDPDYRSDGDLYVADGCLDVWLVDTDTGSTSKVLTGTNVMAIAAVGTDLLYVEVGNVPGEGDLKRLSGTTVTPITLFSFITEQLYVDAAGTSGVLSQRTSFRTVDLATGNLNPGCTNAGMVKLSPNGAEMVYEFRNMLLVHKSDCSGAPTRVARGAKFVAWRSN